MARSTPATLLDIATAKPLLPHEQQFLLNMAKSFNQDSPPVKLPREYTPPNSSAERPGDHFNEFASWDEILEPKGWECTHSKGQVRMALPVVPLGVRAIRVAGGLGVAATGNWFSAASPHVNNADSASAHAHCMRRLGRDAT
jgi:hypothetical protein